MKTIEKILQALQSGQLKAGLEMLVRYATEQLADDPGLRNASINMLARYNQLQRRRIAGVIADSEMQITENQIRFGALELIEELREDANGDGVLPGQERAGGTSPGPSRILFLGADPTDQVRIQVRKEIHAIEDSLRDSQLSNRFEFIPSQAAQPDDLMNMILKKKPEFVHFAGHGTQEGIYMLNERAESILIPNERLGEVFRLFREVVGCVVLNSCFSRPQAMVIRKYVPNVIGTSFKVPDTAAIKFATHFYTAIGDGQEIPFAYEFARVGTNLNEMDGDLFVML